MTGAVLWDMDGMLLDSRDYHWLAWRDTMADEGMQLSYERFLASFGLKNDRILRGWLGDSLGDGDVQRIGDAKEEHYRRLSVEGGVVPLPGAAEWVRRLKQGGWRQAVASSAPRENVEVMLRLLKLEACFDAIAAAEDVTAGKPDPQIFLAAALRLGARPEQSIVVEDAAAGIEAAKAAGMRCIGVSDTTILPADIFVRSLADLPEDAFERLLR